MQKIHENQLLLETVKSFMEKEIYPHEEQVDKAGVIPEELGRHIEKKSIELGLYAANLPENVGGGGLDYHAMALLEREYGKTSHALHSWIVELMALAVVDCNALGSSPRDAFEKPVRWSRT